MQIRQNIDQAINVQSFLTKERAAARGEAHLHRGNELVDSIADRARPAFVEHALDEYGSH